MTIICITHALPRMYFDSSIILRSCERSRMYIEWLSCDSGVFDARPGIKVSDEIYEA